MLSLRIAWRYLKAKKSANIINLITALSVLGLTIGTAALILVLAVFNGLESTIMSFFYHFNPDIKIELKEGKSFSFSPTQRNEMAQIPEIEAVFPTLEEVVLFEYKNQQQVGKIKGVPSGYGITSGLDSTLVEGNFQLESPDSFPQFVAGINLGVRLELNVMDPLANVKVYAVNQHSNTFGGGEDFEKKYARPAGLFSVQQSYDNEYIFAPMDFVQDLLHAKGKYTSLEVYTKSKNTLPQVQKKLRALMGNDFTVKNRLEQQETFLKLLRAEKGMAFLMLSLASLLVAFNMIGALWMIVLDKKQDLIMLKCMGMRDIQVRNIILSLGLLIALIGICIGSIIALIFYYLQQEYGLIGLQDGTALGSYPVGLRILDLVDIYIVVTIIGLIAAIPAARRAYKLEAYI